MIVYLDNHAALIERYFLEELNEIVWNGTKLQVLDQNAHRRFIGEAAFLLIESEKIRV
jgi:hypothetical protein